MLFSVFPLPFVNATVLPVKNSLAFSLVKLESSNVSFAVSPLEMPLTVHFVLEPLSDIRLTVRPQITASSRYLVCKKLASKNASVSKVECALTILFSISIVSFILCPIRPTFNSFSMLFIFEPLSFVNSSMRMSINAQSMRFIIQPHSFIDVSIRVKKSALPVRPVILPHTFVPRAIWPDQSACPMLFTVQSLASVLLTWLIEVVAIRTLVIFLLSFNLSFESRLYLTFTSSLRLISRLHHVNTVCVFNCHLNSLLIWAFLNAVSSTVAHYF